MSATVAIARVLLPAGLEQLQQRFEVRTGGLDAGRETVLELVAGADALVADPAVPSTRRCSTPPDRS